MIFEHIQNFSARFCKIFDKDDVVLPLLPDDELRLCSEVLCKPVQLVITDGVKSETVLFVGCDSGVPVVERGQAGTEVVKFPAGATIQFSWTAANVVAECEGC